jgi:hypothetical protein
LAKTVPDFVAPEERRKPKKITPICLEIEIGLAYLSQTFMGVKTHISDTNRSPKSVLYEHYF